MMCCLACYVTMACSGGKSIRQQRLWEGPAEEGLAGFGNGLQWSAGLCNRMLGSTMACNRVLLLGSESWVGKWRFHIKKTNTTMPVASIGGNGAF